MDTASTSRPTGNVEIVTPPGTSEDLFNPQPSVQAVTILVQPTCFEGASCTLYDWANMGDSTNPVLDPLESSASEAERQRIRELSRYQCKRSTAMPLVLCAVANPHVDSMVHFAIQEKPLRA